MKIISNKLLELHAQILELQRKEIFFLINLITYYF